MLMEFRGQCQVSSSTTLNLLRHYFLVNLKLTTLARLAGQGALGFLLFPATQHQGYKHPSRPSFYMGFGIQTQGPMYTAGASPTESSSSLYPVILTIILRTPLTRNCQIFHHKQTDHHLDTSSNDSDNDKFLRIENKNIVHFKLKYIQFKINAKCCMLQLNQWRYFPIV